MPSPLPAPHAFWQHDLCKSLALDLQQFPANQTFMVGCSGGRDSLLLTYALAQLCPNRIIAVHINHQLHSDATHWATLVATQCSIWQIPCKTINVTLTKGNIEAAARQARYHAFSQVIAEICATQTDELPPPILVLAHHRQDQAETTLLRLLSGSGVRGLSAMQPLTYQNNLNLHIWRPFLAISRQTISQLTNALQLDFIDDPANNGLQYDRVFLRQQVWPLLAPRFNQFEANICRTASLMQDAASILADVIAQDIQQCTKSDTLNIEPYLQLTAPRQRQLLSYWMQGHSTYAPPLAQVQTLQQQVINAQEDASPLLVWNQLQFRRHQQTLYRLPLALPTAKPLQLSLNLGDVIELPSGTWQVVVCVDGFPMAWLNQPILLMPRQGGEKLHFKNRIGKWPLKKFLNTVHLPVWCRAQIHLLYLTQETSVVKQDDDSAITKQSVQSTEQPLGLSTDQVIGVVTSTGFLHLASIPSETQGWCLQQV